MKSFVYMIQSESDMPYPELQDEQNDIILLTWKKPSDLENSIFFPQSTWTEGRNRLLKEAFRKNEDYLYYIFLDGDCIVKEDTELASELNIELCGNPFRTLEKYLTEWQPAVGYTRYSWQYHEPEEEVNIGHNIDAIFNAFHKETISFLLPYYTGFDCESWLYSQHVLNHLTSLFYHEHKIQFNVITTRNRIRKSYALRKKYWAIPAAFLLNSIKSDLKDRINLKDPNSIYPLPGNPRKKEGSYRISDSFLEKHFNMQHCLMKFRKKDNLPSPIRLSQKKNPKIAVCMSGRCRGLDKTYNSIRKCLLDQTQGCDLFIYTPEDSYSHLAELLSPAAIEIEKDKPVAEGNLVNNLNCRLKTGVQPYLQQLYGLKKCNRLRLDYEKKMNIHYDCIIRCRPDLMFVKPVDDLFVLDLSYIHVPDFHQFDGINDRFAVGATDHMNIYMNKLDEFHTYVEEWFKYSSEVPAVSAEMFTSGQLRNYNIPVRPHPFRFNRVRDYGVKNDV